MRILRLLTRPNVGGPARQAEALYHAHAATGHETLLVTGVCEPDEPVMPFEIPRALAAREPGHRVIESLTRRPTWRADRHARREFAQIVRDFEPDVVHTHTSKAGWIGRAVARKLGVRAVVHTYHGIVLRDYYSAPMAWLLTRIERRLARRTGMNVAVSESCRDELAELGIRDAVVIPPAVPVHAHSRAAAREELGIDDDAVVLGFVGRLVRVKQPGVFVEVVQAMPDTRGIMIGDGTAKMPIESSRLRHVRGCHDAARLIPAFDLLVVPSLREGFPLVVVEAAAAGVRSIGFDVPGVRDAVSAAGGRVVPAAAGVRGLVEGVRAALQARTGVDRTIVAKCDPVRVADSLIGLYRTMLAP